ncbi:MULTISPECIES: glycoside hydrolase family 88 protein [unclassified Arcicella]|uniref:glycoside hydrolase family 88 protein n=1 Tax=unclassified Arcicella TaxID=2644986 RepID=UPI0028610EEA|nr:MULTISPECIES: glycoside hydrolase family 88 protein [unclassified Arcicella]MDR6562280.1 rhamnogalacturonyl hydrolase YesR [Arcicella sp. BE51]MDR6812026.1 rhamnogalacturonyl hydrolase YesR [Arcicella sp. BE140]MDR6823337.1 rhamnogalacturonyl hydrolase YesR [Arcicella sp. BE139]
MNIFFTRRQMLAIATTMATAVATAFGSRDKKSNYQYLLAKLSGSEATLPEGKYIPFDLSFGEISLRQEVKLSWNQSIPDKTEFVRLRITSATDVRETLVLEVRTAISGKKIAVWDFRFAALLQPFELEIPAKHIKAVFSEGVTLRMIEGTKPFWFFTGSSSEKTAPQAYLPHLLVYGEELQKDAWKDRLLSFGSLQTFGWQQGIVWDGLLDLSKHSTKAKTVLEQQLNLYFANNSLVYCNLNNIKTIEKIHTVESILPFAILAQTNPTHPLLETAISFCEAHANTLGVIADGTGNNRMVKTEECYTVSYPLAVLAKVLNRPDLVKLSIETLKSRIEVLEKGNSIYQRGTEQGELFFENWSRGVAWYLLGLAKTLVHLPESTEKESLTISFKKSVEKVLTYQQHNGLWYNFFHQPDTGFETSGTAGIAAALKVGFQHGFLNETAKKAAMNASIGLFPYLAPDGYLTGTAQVNKGGEALQKNGFRVISPYTLGFLAHLTIK